MCGIAGLWPANPRGATELVAEMLAQIAHRGPDGQGVWQDPRGTVTLGHARLSIIDLSDNGRQPMATEDGTVVTTFNGEIYNYKELRAELEGQGVTFRSVSDTEVLLKGYQAWGTGVLDRLVGMFSFAIWDARQELLFVARDRAGEKPLYYSYTGNNFAFASELRAFAPIRWLDRTLDLDAVALYLHYQYIPSPYTVYKGIQKLPPAHALTLQKGQLKIWRYWDPVPLALGPRIRISHDEAVKELEALLGQAVRGQMISDVPLGAFLSGGIDSTAVVCLMREYASVPVKTFTIGFEVDGYNESEHAGAVARFLGTDHTVEYLTEKDALDLVPRIPDMYSEPFADSSALPTHLVSAVARKHVTVSLSGDGGDEAFGGYTRYQRFEKLYPWMRRGAALKGILNPVAGLLPGRLSRLAGLCGQNPEEVYRGFISIYSASEVQQLTGQNPSLAEYDRAWAAGAGAGGRRLAMLADLLTYMPEAILVKVDRAAMATSLETRAPLLDHRVLEFSLKLPQEWVTEKSLLKEVVYKRVPRQLLDRPKQGFGVPIGAWFRGELRSLLLDSLTPSRLQAVGIENTQLVTTLLEEHLAGTRNHSARLWALLVLTLWAGTHRG